MQSRQFSLLEAAANVVVGLVLAFLLQRVLFYAMAIAASFGQSLVLTLAFALLSLVRSYVLRRLFERFGHRRPDRPSGQPLESPSRKAASPRPNPASPAVPPTC